MAYWVLGAHPRNYRVVDSVLEQDQDTWRTGDRPLTAGDQVAIYKYKGREALRGVVALGEVLTDPEEMDFPEDHPYALPGMRQRLGARALGVLVRYLHPPRLPLWVDERPDSVVNELSVTRAQGGTAFRITDEQWERLLQEAGGWPAGPAGAAREPTAVAITSLVRGRGGQGFGLTAVENDVIEDHAMKLAEEHFRDRGWSVLDVSANFPYDLRCTRGEEECRVEVKGTTTDGDTVFLTRNEVIAAQTDPPRAVLVLVSKISLAAGPDRTPVATGGQLRLLHPWNPAADELDPIAYKYRVPPP